MDEFTGFSRSINLRELCTVASACRRGMMCQLGNHTIGGFNVIYELNFSDGVTWLARIPLPYNCYQPEEITISYAAALRYIKKNSTIPVPKVYTYNVQSAPENKVNATYLLMEYLPGHALPTLEPTSLHHNPEDKVLVMKLHAQLTDVMLQLASLRFDKIGSLREAPDGTLFVGPYTETNATAYPKYKAVAYKKLEARYKGPFSSTSEWHQAMAELNRKVRIEDPEVEGDRAEIVAEYELLAELSDHFVIREFSQGPFVLNHNDLTLQNILVDDDFNITGIIDFPGTVVPLDSLCVYPWLFSDSISGLMTDRDIYLDVFLNRECRFPSSLRSLELRRSLMKTATPRQNFELGLMGPYISVVLPRLYTEIYGHPFSPKVEYQRIVDTRNWFKRLVPPGKDGLYSWQRN